MEIYRNVIMVISEWQDNFHFLYHFLYFSNFLK